MSSPSHETSAFQAAVWWYLKAEQDAVRELDCGHFKITVVSKGTF